MNMDIENYEKKCNHFFWVVGVALLAGSGVGKCNAAAYKFNPDFINENNTNIADLSSFEQGLELLPGTYQVEVYVNKNHVKKSSLLFEVKQEKTEAVLLPCMSYLELAELGVSKTALDALKIPADAKCVDFAQIPDLSVRFDQQAMIVYFSIPQVFMDKSAKGYIPPEMWDSGLPIAMLNYTFNGSDYHYRNENTSNRQSYFLGLNGGVNWGEWRFRNQQNWNYNNQNGGKWSYINSYLQRNILFLRSQLTLGDTNTSFNVFDSVGLRGIQLESQDSMLPDSQQGFAPTVRGIAKSNAKVTIRQNNNVIYQTFVPPGAFLIDDLYPTSSSGDLQVEIEEENGQLISYMVPYSSVPNLVREGHVKYAVSAGEYRTGYDDVQDNPLYFQGSLFWGVGAGWTLYGGTQLAEKYQAVAMGAARNMGRWGAISTDITHADSVLADGEKYSGNSILLRYAKSITDFGTNLNFATYRYSTAGFYSLGDTAYKSMVGEQVEYNIDENGKPVSNVSNSYNLRYAKKSMSQILLSQSLGDYGSAYISFNNQNYWNTEKSATNKQIGYSGNKGALSYTLSYSENKNPWATGVDKVFNMSLSLPLANLLPKTSVSSVRINTSMMNASNGDRMESVGLSGNAFEDNELSYSINQYYRRNSSNGGNASVNYKGRYGNTDLGYSYSSDSRFIKYGVSGGMVVHENGLTLGQQLGNTNILVDAEGASGVTVVNGTGIKTDNRGYAIIPYATAYRENRVQLNIDTLGQDVELDDAFKTVVPTEGAMVRASFKARVGKKAMFKVLGDAGKLLPFGTIVSTTNGNTNAGIIDDTGMVYISGLSQKGQLVAQWGSGEHQSCTIAYDISGLKPNETTGIYNATVRCQ
jgi:outer membrane usher protein